MLSSDGSGVPGLVKVLKACASPRMVHFGFWKLKTVPAPSPPALPISASPVFRVGRERRRIGGRARRLPGHSRRVAEEDLRGVPEIGRDRCQWRVGQGAVARPPAVVAQPAAHEQHRRVLLELQRPMRHRRLAEGGEAERRILGRIVDLAGRDPVAERVNQPGRLGIPGQPARELGLGRRRHDRPGLAVDHHRGRRRGAQRGVQHDIDRVLQRVVARGIERPQAGRQRRILRRLRSELAEQALRILGRMEAEAAIELVRGRAIEVDVPLLRAAADRLEALEHGEVEAGDTGHGFSPPKERTDRTRIACNSPSGVLHRVYRGIAFPTSGHKSLASARHTAAAWTHLPEVGHRIANRRLDCSPK
jgi:hypothetical protein